MLRSNGRETFQISENRSVLKTQIVCPAELRRFYRQIISVEDARPDAEEARKFCSDIWDKPVKHNRGAACLKKVREELISEKQTDLQTLSVLLSKCRVRRSQNKI